MNGSVTPADRAPLGEMPSWTPRVGGNTATVADVGEAGVLAAITPHLTPADAEIGPGDDAAVLPTSTGRTVVTTDSMVLGLDWRDDWSSPHEVGVKVIAQNIADVEAMGARPTGVVVALACEPGTHVDWLVELTEGMADELRRAGCGALGGDLSGAAQGTAVITVTALGDLPPGAPVLRRDAARVGEVLVVSDVLGRSHAGLLLLQGEVKADDEAAGLECMRWHRAPRPRHVVQEALDAGTRCAMDVSDGLGRDAGRLAAASHVRIDLDRPALEVMARSLRPVVGTRALECVVSGGEEHAVLATCARERVPSGWHVIGVVTAGEGVWLGDERVDERGWSHYGASDGWRFTPGSATADSVPAGSDRPVSPRISGTRR